MAANPVHGVLVAIGEIGLLLRGPSGVGKSECALELVRRGHCLVADDVVEIAYDPADGGPVGAPPVALAGRLEVQGVGIVSVETLFGAQALRTRQRIDAVVDLLPPAPHEPRQRPLHPPPLAHLLGHPLPAFALSATEVAAVANKVEIIARLLATGVHGA